MSTSKYLPARQDPAHGSDARHVNPCIVLYLFQTRARARKSVRCRRLSDQLCSLARALRAANAGLRGFLRFAWFKAFRRTKSIVPTSQQLVRHRCCCYCTHPHRRTVLLRARSGFASQTTRHSSLLHHISARATPISREAAKHPDGHQGYR